MKANDLWGLTRLPDVSSGFAIFRLRGIPFKRFPVCGEP